jgi:Fe-S-cluster containining protein
MNKPVKKSYLWDYDKKIAIQYVRIGECNMCGACCRGTIHFSVVNMIDKDNPDNGGMATSREGQWVEVCPNGHKIYFKMREYERCDRQCKYLQTNNACGVYSERSTLCREWPFSPSDIVPFPDCSYKFFKVGQWDFDDIMKQEMMKKEKRVKDCIYISQEKNRIRNKRVNRII